MASKKLWLVPAALVLGVGAASADTLVMEDGRRIRGELVSVNRGVVVFDQQDDFLTRTRRIRVRLDSVERIDLVDEYERDDDQMDDDDQVTWPGGWNRDDRDLTVWVRGNQHWSDTGISLNRGDTFRIEASGVVGWAPNRQDGPGGEPNSSYNSNRPLPNRPSAALIGRVGNGEPFFIGSGQTTFRAGNSGRLYLGINDDYVQDNSGSFRVRVSR